MTIDALSCGEALDHEAFEELSRRAVLDCFQWNLANEGRSRLCRYPLVVERSLFAELSAWAIALDAEARVAEAELVAYPELQRALGLPLRLRLALRRASSRDGPRYARYDFHPVDEGGFAITEGNVDVAGGFNEASGIAALFSERVPGAEVAGDPAAALAASIVAKVGGGATVGCFHMTQFADDHQVVRFVGKHLEEAGLTPVFFGPSQLRWLGSHAAALVGARSVRLDAVFRFFPADWLPRLAVSSRWWRVFEPGATSWVNPATTVLTQSKRFPLAWPGLRAPLPTWMRLLPETRHPRDIDGGEWVIKPALAHEGYRVGIRGVTEPSAYARIVREAQWLPWRWVAQRRFRAASMATPDGQRFPCVGVYVVDGRVAGLYGRLSERPLTDDKSEDAVVLLRKES